MNRTKNRKNKQITDKLISVKHSDSYSIRVEDYITNITLSFGDWLCSPITSPRGYTSYTITHN